MKLPRFPRPALDRWDVLTSLGGLLMAVGAGMIYGPAGVILGGVLLILAGLLGAAHPDKERAP